MKDKEAALSLFPYDSVRPVQRDMIDEVYAAVSGKHSIIVHAPTGLGKTAAALSPALAYALKHGKTIFFLTSRHTQHIIAVETLNLIRKKHSVKFGVADIIGKKHMCAMPGISLLASRDFTDYCKSARKEGSCEFYSRTRKDNVPTFEARKLIAEIKDKEFMHTEALSAMCREQGFCPYEIAALLSRDAGVVIADYSYVFNHSIRDSFFSRTGKSLSDCILIIDEGHNLPSRMRDMSTVRLTTIMLKRAMSEANKAGMHEHEEKLRKLLEIFDDIGGDLVPGKEMSVKKHVIVQKVGEISYYEDLIEDLREAADVVRSSKNNSFMGGVADFLAAWLGEDEGFARIMACTPGSRESFLTLSYRCLDPSLITKEVIAGAHSTILMSGTLNPTAMYRDLLGFSESSVERAYESPFNEDNRLTIVVPETTTKFSMRNAQQFRRIAEICAQIVNTIPGNSAIFFPSYAIRDAVNDQFSKLVEKTSFLEQQGMSKEDKAEMLGSFKSYQKSGAVLLGTVSGSFGEGIDLPGDFLKGVVVVGLPLQQPDLETKEVIAYYDKKYGKGWDYGYIFPAFNKIFQSAGRCIRSETDRGVVVFIDERFVWPIYKRCFPHDSEIVVTQHFKELIEEFF
ncbi:MAG TPA: ATP-dependent DNA helicase [Candidatus Nanoarchaeia archaeon]|nr:ATP-dependent DNA helicase [Candidatus Nanoarchaeia archaeon]